MKYVLKYYGLFALLTLSFSISPGQTTTQQIADPVVAEFESRANTYANNREEIARSLPKVSEKATPEEVAAHKARFLKAVQARLHPKHGAIFTPEISAYLKKLIAVQLNVAEKAELRKEVIEAENKAVAVRVNYPYPEAQEILEMPAALLQVLPQLPRELKFRFVGRHMLLVDRENSLIVDYITNAVP